MRCPATAWIVPAMHPHLPVRLLLGSAMMFICVGAIHEALRPLWAVYWRSCPSPKTMNFAQVSAVSPIGPRAWMRLVEMPISAPRPS